MTISYSDLTKPAQKLFTLQLYGRWSFVAIAWLTLAPLSIWELREDISIIQDHFTWAAVRYSLAFNILPAYCLFFCVAITGSVLVWQSLYILKGISPREQLRLENQVKKIQITGPKHPLWKWIFK